MRHYQLNPESEIPIYRQLADQINAEIRSGALKTGAQLPTVREMADQMHLSCGTVKRVYDHLRDLGDIEMTRRRGTFVKYVREDGDSRKASAMTAIDQMIRRLTDLHFSPGEIQIFLNLKLREWGLKWSGIRVVIVAPCEEISPALERQVSRLGNIHVTCSGIAQVREYPYSMDEQADVILVSDADVQALQSFLPDRSKLVKIAMAPTQKSVAEIAKHSGRRMGVLCGDVAFLRLLKKCFPEERFEACGTDDLPQCIVVPEDWRELYDPQICARVEACADHIEFGYQIDAGSMIHLEECIGRIRDARKMQPGTLMF